MDTMVNPFTADAFNMASLTDAINILPNMYGRLKQKNMFPDKGIITRSVMVEEKNGVLNLIQSQPVGSPGALNKSGKRKVRSFSVPHLPLDDVILPEEYQGIRAFGRASEVATLAQIMNDHLQSMRNKHDITKEYLRMGALKGIILDADGSTMYNLYTEFGISQKTVDFALDSDTTDVAAKCREVLRHVEDNLLGEVADGVEVLVSEEFFDALIAHPNVEKFFANHAKALELAGRGEDPRKGFQFGGLRFEEYRGKATDAAGTTRRFIAASEGHAYPTGTLNSFVTYNSPADFLETANTIGMPYYAKQEPRKFNRGVDLHSQSNPLPLCLRPGLLVKVTI